MGKLKEELWNTLQDLKEEDFEKFKWFLTHDNNVEGYSRIPVAEVEKAERHRTVDLLVQKYNDPGALLMTMKVLEKISRNDLVERLQNFRAEPRDLKSGLCVAVRCDFEKKKAKLGTEIKLMIQERQIKIGEIKHSKDLSNKSANRYIASSERVYSLLLQTLKESFDNLIASVNEKRRTTQKVAEEYIQELEKEISELTKRSTEVEMLSTTNDQLNNQSFAHINDFPPTKEWKEINIPPPSYGGSVATAVNQLEEKLRKEKEKFINKGKLYRVQQFAKDVTLDPDTANPWLIVSDDRRQVHCGHVKLNLRDNSKRFLSAVNVLANQSFSSGRFYYEVHVEGKTSWDLGVVKESIHRKGSITASPEHGYWTICLRKGQTYATHFKLNSKPNKVGVFVNFEDNSVSFFDVDSAEIIYKFTNCSFEEKSSHSSVLVSMLMKKAQPL